jgi:hypothetical protein
MRKKGGELQKVIARFEKEKRELGHKYFLSNENSFLFS